MDTQAIQTQPVTQTPQAPAVIQKVEKNPKQKAWWDKADVEWLDDGGNIRFPKDYHKNLQYRIWIKELNNPGVDDDCLIKGALVKKCEDDIHFFFNTFLWTQDPRKDPSDLPFITYKFQDIYINWLVEHILKGKDCLTEKSRDMGVSWLSMGVFLHAWLFKPGFLGHVGSKKEDDVDRSGDIRSLFEKSRYLIKRMPKWLRPYGFEWKKNSMFMRLINPMNNNAITGESSNRDFGRAGRYSAVFLDEFASMEYAEEAWTSTGDSTPCRIAASTPKGTGGKFWQLRFKSDINKFTAHWTLHPEKAKEVINVKTKALLSQEEAFNAWKEGEEVSSLWYESEKNRRLTKESQSSVDIGQELDIDYLASGDPYFNIKELVKQEEWLSTEDWVYFGDSVKKKVIIGNLTEIDGKIEFRPNKNGWLRLFEKPRKQSQYVGGLDAAEGLVNRDYSAGAFRDKKSRNLVAAIYGHFGYDELSMYGFLTARYFNNCLICAEAGGYGAAVNKRLYDLGANVARAVDLSTGGVKEKDKLGWINSSVSRPKALGDMDAEIRENACELRDKDLKNECMNFVNKNGKPQASEGSTDDFIFAYAIAGQLLRFRPYSEELAKSILKRRNSRGLMPKANMGFGFKQQV